VSRQQPQQGGERSQDLAGRPGHAHLHHHMALGLVRARVYSGPFTCTQDTSVKQLAHLQAEGISVPPVTSPSWFPTGHIPTILSVYWEELRPGKNLHIVSCKLFSTWSSSTQACRLATTHCPLLILNCLLSLTFGQLFQSPVVTPYDVAWEL
jgi:hypothetical protein